MVNGGLDVRRCDMSGGVRSGPAWPGRREWRPTQLCGYCVQPVRRCPSEGASVGRRDSDDGGVGWRGVRLRDPAFVLEVSWAKALATATPLGAASLLGASCFPL